MTSGDWQITDCGLCGTSELCRIFRVHAAGWHVPLCAWCAPSGHLDNGPPPAPPLAARSGPDPAPIPSSTAAPDPNTAPPAPLIATPAAALDTIAAELDTLADTLAAILAAVKKSRR